MIEGDDGAGREVNVLVRFVIYGGWRLRGNDIEQKTRVVLLFFI